MTQKELNIGDTAPAFTLPRDGGEQVSLTDYAGQAVVLYFYPRDDTPGCTKEAIGFTEMAAEFAAANTVVIGASKDSVKKHDKFRDKHSLGVVLVSDEESDLCETYGVWVEKNMYGKTYLGIERATFLIGPDGKIAQIWRKVKVPGHVEAVLQAARALDAA
ncbi:thioredoxin-dependent thiol peroxidase [Nereida ignava]|uniref:thioredoxin-dependent peroxiredoxin n=1 Tax=Nereida ignava TaxID=282199 RepID=A0A0U1NLS7_9RHOB|nr:thioredoxin-dependent thiol peroxidase [Nereida ignava]CRK75667.1 Putative peroxiredoxin bcp [Nereida ignava]SFJ31269.1 peroxiredoxin Q/BCP [Nereida ignava DSM 16309]